MISDDRKQKINTVRTFLFVLQNKTMQKLQPAYSVTAQTADATSLNMSCAVIPRQRRVMHELCVGCTDDELARMLHVALIRRSQLIARKRQRMLSHMPVVC